MIKSGYEKLIKIIFIVTNYYKSFLSFNLLFNDSCYYWDLSAQNILVLIIYFQVHTCSWRNKPSSEFLTQMSELTSGCCGADLQALCAEAFLCCLKRLYPNLYRPLLGNKVKIEAQSIVVRICFSIIFFKLIMVKCCS